MASTIRNGELPAGTPRQPAALPCKCCGLAKDCRLGSLGRRLTAGGEVSRTGLPSGVTLSGGEAWWSRPSVTPVSGNRGAFELPEWRPISVSPAGNHRFFVRLRPHGSGAVEPRKARGPGLLSERKKATGRGSRSPTGIFLAGAVRLGRVSGVAHRSAGRRSTRQAVPVRPGPPWCRWWPGESPPRSARRPERGAAFRRPPSPAWRSCRRDLRS